jgi:hypothetical protein
MHAVMPGVADSLDLQSPLQSRERVDLIDMRYQPDIKLDELK